MTSKELTSFPQIYFSIIVPNRNYSQYLVTCLSSIAFQECTNYEVLICDGCSSDNSLDLISEYLRDSRFKLVSTSDNGQANAINKAISISLGTYITYLNSDDYYLSTKTLSTALAYFSSHPNVHVVSFGGFYSNSAGQLVKKIDYSLNGFVNLYDFNKRVALLQPGSFWRRNVHDCGLIFREDFKSSFDTLFFWDLYSLGFIFLLVDTPVACYRLHGDNISTNNYLGKLHDKSRFLRIQKKYFSSCYLTFFYRFFSSLNMFLPAKIADKVLLFFRFFNNSLSYITHHFFPSF